MAKAKVTLNKDEGIDSLLRRFKKAVEREDVMQEARKRQFFLKKALRRKQKARYARIKARRG